MPMPDAGSFGASEPAAATTLTAPPTAALAALCAALSSSNPARVRELLAPGRVDWNALDDAAGENRLSGFLYAELRARGLESLVPPPALLSLRRTYLDQWTRAGRLLREIERLARAFEAKALPVLFFKGPLLAARLYAQLGSRAIHDIDFLIPDARAMPDYDAVLAPLGYRRISRLVLPLRWSRAWLYQLEYRSPAFALEPHWALTNHPSIRLDTARMWREREAVAAADGGTLPMLSDEYTLVANLLSIPADLQNASLKLRTWLELFLLWRRLPADTDWAAFWERRRGERTLRLALASFAVLRELFGPKGLERASASAPRVESESLVAALRAAAVGPALAEWPRRRLALGLFETPLPLSLGWWAATLPGRALAHPALTLARLRRW